MNKFYFCSIFSLLTFYSNSLFAIENIYLRGDIGFSRSNSIKNNQLFYKESGEKKFKNGFITSVGLGYKLNKDFTTELAYSKIDNLRYEAKDIDLIKAGHTFSSNYKQKLDLQSLMVNLYYNITLKNRFTPYLGLGLGYSHIEFSKASRFTKQTNFTKSYKGKNSNNFSYALMIGSMIKINNKFDIDLGYRFQDYGKSKGFNYMMLNNVKSNSITNISSGYRVKIHSIMGGIRYNF